MTHYVIVRKDVPLGVIAAQVTHAAGESFAKWAFAFAHAKHTKVFPSLLRGEPTTAVVLEADDNEHLKKIARMLRKKNIHHVAICEPDAPWNGQMMAIGVLPGEREALKPYFKGLSLLRDNDMRRKPARKI